MGHVGPAAAEMLFSVFMLALRSVRRNMLRSFLTILGIVIGVSAVITMVTLGDGAVVNRRACVETHLFHDRLMRIGTATIGPGASLGPSSAILPDAAIGAGSNVGGRSVVLRGEELPAGTRWHGAPVVAA